MVIAPREFGQVLSDAMNGLANTWKTLLLPALMAFIPVSVATIVTFRVTGGASFLNLVLNQPEDLPTLPEDVFWEFAEDFYLAVGIALAMQIIGGVFVALASHSAAAAQVKGERLSGGEATRAALSRYLTGLGATVAIVVVLGVLIGLGAVLWLVPAISVGTPTAASELVALILLVAVLGPGIWVGVSVSMTTSAIAVERRGVRDSIRRSIRLVRGRWWPTAGFLILVGFLGGIALQLIQLVALPLFAAGGSGVALGVASALGVIGQGILVAAIASMWTHWYIDLRARKESLSTESLG